MMRVRNEARWIRRSLERTWQVCKTVVIFDDHSTDLTFQEAAASLGESEESPPSTPVSIVISEQGDRELHWLTSPFHDVTEEVRDKNMLWEYVSTLRFRHVLCLDGDEMLSQSALRNFGAATDRLERGGSDVIIMPFVYLWDSETTRRVDGVYADIRHARLFTIDRAPYFQKCRFTSHGRAGFHCGSIPDRLSVNRVDMQEMSVIHFGYIDNPLRQKKLVFYNGLDPYNEGEGYYKHIVGEPNHLAPGPVRVVDYFDK
jgi:hypothetical protein